jgi:proteasome accessory factor B
MNRMEVIHKHLIAEAYPNCSKLARTLEVSTKTIQRDIDYMRDQLGHPIDYDPGRHGYYYTEAVAGFPSIKATEGEVLALFVAEKALSQYRGTPFEKPLAKAFEKLAEVMQDEISVNLEELAGALSFRLTGHAVTDLEIYRKVNKALLENRELMFCYKKLKGTRPEHRRVHPYHLASIDGQWYLFAHDLARKDIRTFVLGRIREITGVGKKFKKPKDFSLTDRLMGSFGVFKGEGDFRVRLVFDPAVAQLVRERTWHSSQELKELPGGAIELGMRLDSLEEVERWILSWGGHVRVIAPPQLKKRVRDSLKDMSDSYSESPRWLAELHEAAQSHQPDRIMQLVMSIDRGIEHPDQMHLGLNK